ncbi:probable calcium-binding protein CML46 [Salvia miltiorrhiza]|uniref:probable calcium-binding protein CML46 n=1 Tax=Salvia miltiorrhiza TaxID=226208 RepID=UPI0025AD833D|nr:probable calcium-binding protein CML46 [Salvia miltiorrhiza]
MELRLANIVSNLLLLLFNSLFGDVEKFITKVRFLLGSFSTISSSPCNEQVLHASKVGEGMSIAEMNMVMNRLGMTSINGNSSVGDQDLAALFEEEEPSFDEIKETFRIFEANNDGFIDASDLHRIVSSLGLKERYDLEEYKRMITAFDTNGDELIDFQEFLIFTEKCLC